MHTERGEEKNGFWNLPVKPTQALANVKIQHQQTTATNVNLPEKHRMLVKKQQRPRTQYMVLFKKKTKKSACM